MTTWLNTPIQMQFGVIEGLSVRFADSEDRRHHALCSARGRRACSPSSRCGRAWPSMPIWWRSTCRGSVSLVEIGVDKNTTVVFPAPLMSTIAELGSFLASEQAAATRALPPSSDTNRPPTALSRAADTAP